MLHRFLTLFRTPVVLACLFAGSVLMSEAPKDATGASCALEAIPPSPSLLTAPEGIAGDFAVAKEAPKVEFAVLPGQWDGAELWSAWGDAVWASDGKCYASIGDHHSPHGTSYVYQVDPDKKTVKLIVDVNATIQVPADKYTPGKIHAPLVDLGDGWLYIVTYRGRQPDTTVERDYKGDWLLRYQFESGKVENLGVMVPHSSVPVMVGHKATKRLYGLSAPGMTMPERRNQFFVYDVAERKLVFVGGPETASCRALILADNGLAFYDHGGFLVRYDPEKNDVAKTEAKLPGNGTLRAASQPNANGVCFCITQDGVVFSFDTRTEAVKEMTKAFVADPLYTAVCKLSPDGRSLYYSPGAHGGTSKHGTALIQLDVATGKRKVIAFLNALLREKKDYNLGGTYAIALNKDGTKVFIGWNGGSMQQKGKDFGLCSVMVLGIPESERK